MNRGDYMLIDLSNVLSEPHKSLDETVPCTLEVFQSKLGTFPVLSIEDVYITIDYVKDRQIEIHGTCGLVIEIPCDRCLEPVPTEFHLDFTKKVEAGVSEEEKMDSDEFDESNYIDGYALDVDKLIYNEVLIGWPTKILCSEDCKGICNVCGQNLNQGTCSCEDTSLDPRMSVIRDVFKNFKEV